MSQSLMLLFFQHVPLLYSMFRCSCLGILFMQEYNLRNAIGKVIRVKLSGS